MTRVYVPAYGLRLLIIGIALVCAVAGTMLTQVDAMPIANYTLVFSDEFNGSALDSTKWYATRTQDFSGYGQEIWDPARVSISGGYLALTATEDLHSGEVQSLSSFRYGYYEARMKFPGSVGFWSGFWVVSINGSYQEIDIAESDSSDRHRTGMNLHWGTATSNFVSNGGWSDPAFDSQNAFHTYGVLYLPDRIEFYVDDILRRKWIQPSPAVIVDAMQSRLSMSIFGPKQPYASPPNSLTVWPQKLLVDWVRVWQPLVATPERTKKPHPTRKPGAVPSVWIGSEN